MCIYIYIYIYMMSRDTARVRTEQIFSRVICDQRTRYIDKFGRSPSSDVAAWRNDTSNLTIHICISYWMLSLVGN